MGVRYLLRRKTWKARRYTAHPGLAHDGLACRGLQTTARRVDWTRKRRFVEKPLVGMGCYCKSNWIVKRPTATPLTLDCTSGLLHCCAPASASANAGHSPLAVPHPSSVACQSPPSHPKPKPGPKPRELCPQFLVVNLQPRVFLLGADVFNPIFLRRMETGGVLRLHAGG